MDERPNPICSHCGKKIPNRTLQKLVQALAMRQKNEAIMQAALLIKAPEN